jgi:glycosyltransferase involved in cell wall biosynthesis
MKTKPYILFLPKWYPCRNMTLSGIFIQRHAKAISNLIDVVVLYAIYDENLRSKWIEKEEKIEQGVLTIRYYYKKRFTGISQLDKFIKFLIYFLCFIKGYRYITLKRGKPVLIHVHVLLRTGIFACFKKVFSNIDYIISEHWSGYLKESNSYQGYLRKIISEFIVKKALCVTTVSEALRNAMLANGLKNEYKVIPNVIDTDKFKCELPEKQKEKLSIISIGLLKDDVKNISTVLRVIKKMSDQRKDFEFILIGRGEDEFLYRQYCLENEILDKIVFIKGYIKPELIPGVICQSDFLLQYSHFETQGTALLEAMACGKPVLASEVGGMKELINDKNGILVKTNNEQDLYDKLSFMLDNFRSFNPEIIRKNIIDNFSNKVVGEKFYNLYAGFISLKNK